MASVVLEKKKQGFCCSENQYWLSVVLYESLLLPAVDWDSASLAIRWRRWAPRLNNSTLEWSSPEVFIANQHRNNRNDFVWLSDHLSLRSAAKWAAFIQMSEGQRCFYHSHINSLVWVSRKKLNKKVINNQLALYYVKAVQTTMHEY